MCDLKGNSKSGFLFCVTIQIENTWWLEEWKAVSFVLSLKAFCKIPSDRKCKSASRQTNFSLVNLKTVFCQIIFSFESNYSVWITFELALSYISIIFPLCPICPAFYARIHKKLFDREYEVRGPSTLVVVVVVVVVVLLPTYPPNRDKSC